MRKVFFTLVTAMLLIAAMSSCFRESDGGGGDGKPADLRLIFYGDMTPRREEFFKKDFHDRILEELNINLTVEAMSWGSDRNIATMLATGEKFAVYNIVSAFDWPSKGYLAEIDEALVREKLPDLIRVRGPNNGFECVKYNGKIYAIPFGNKPYAGTQQTFTVRNDLLRSVGLDADNITTYDQLVSAMAAIRTKYPNLRMIRGSGFLSTALVPAISDQLYFNQGTYFVYVNELEPGAKVYSFFESDIFKKAAATAVEWVRLGYIQMDELAYPTQGEADWNAGNCFMMYGVAGALIDEANLRAVNPDIDLKLVKLGNKPLIKVNDYDWGLSISAADEANVPQWLDLFNWIYKNQENYDFCVYGVEGKDWERSADGTIRKIVNDAFFDSWFLQAMPYVSFDPSIPRANIEQYVNYDNGSILSKRSGFTFDATPISSELATMTAVWTEMLRPMTFGLLDFEGNYAEAIRKLKAAGLDKYVAEYQRQFSAWFADKN
jgi:putative aldouronate transport system substrate-binding protein